MLASLNEQTKKGTQGIVKLQNPMPWDIWVIETSMDLKVGIFVFSSWRKALGASKEKCQLQVLEGTWLGLYSPHFARVPSEIEYKAGQTFNQNNTATLEVLATPFLKNNSG